MFEIEMFWGSYNKPYQSCFFKKCLPLEFRRELSTFVGVNYVRSIHILIRLSHLK